MSFAKGSFLQSLVRSRLTSMTEGAVLTQTYLAFRDFDVEVLKSPPKSSKDSEDKGPGHYRAGSTLRLTTKVELSGKGIIGTIAYPPELYRLAMVSGPTIIDEQHDQAGIAFTVQLLYPLDINQISPLRVFIHKEV